MVQPTRPIWPGNPLQHARVHKSELETPALLVDLDIMESNIATMAAHCRSTGVGLRPHVKTHKTPAIANKQIAAGAVGICCSTLGEAEVMAAAGVGDILITRPVVGATKIVRLCGLTKHIRVQVVTDSHINVDELASVAESLKAPLQVLIEINVGQNRGGVDPVSGDALNLARRIAGHEWLRFAGLQAYEGHLVLHPDPNERNQKAPLANRAGRETKAMIEQAGIECPTLSGGGTGTYDITGDSRVSGYTELQAGSYVTMDARYSAQMGDVPFGPALSLLSTCIGRPVPNRIILDAGQKVVTVEFGPPEVRNHTGMKYLSGVGGDEHGVVITEGEDVAIGEQVELIPSHGCTAFNLHNWVYGLRKGYVEVVWPVAARGCSW